MKIWLSLWLALICVPAAAGQKKIIRAVVPDSFPPHYSLDRNGAPTGFAVDVMDRVAAIAGVRVRYIVKSSWDEVFDAMENGDADVIPNLGITPGREVFCRFSKPVETFHISMFVRAGSLWQYDRDKKAKDKVGVVRRNAGSSLLDRFPQAEIIVFEDPEHALFQGLLAGRVDAIVYPEPVIRHIALKAGLLDRIRVAGPPLLEIKRAIAVCRNNPGLLAEVNRVLEIFLKSPEYKTLYVKWHGAPAHFWTSGRVAQIMGAGVFFVTIVMFLWRYYSIRSLNLTLRKTTRRYRTLVRLSPVGIFRSDTKGDILWVNEKWQVFSGMPQAGALGRGWEASVHPKDRKTVLGSWQRALEEDRTFESDFRFLRPEGGTTWVTARAVPEKDGQGKTLGYIGTVTDITRRKRFERALQGVLDALPLNIAVLDKAGWITATNSRWDAFSGENGGSFEHTGPGINYFEACRRAGDDIVLNGLKAVRDRTADIFIWEYPCDSDSDNRWYLLWVIPLEDGSGGIVVSHMDITKRKLAENELEKHRQDLAAQVRERTYSLEAANKELMMNEERLAALLQLSLMVDKTEKEIVDFALKEAVRLTRSEIGYLHFVNPDKKALTLFTWTEKTFETCKAKNASHHPVSDAGIWADSLRTGKPVIHNDYPGIADKDGLPDGHFPVHRHMSVPVMDANTTVAVAGVGNKEAAYVDSDANRLMLFMSTMWSILQRQRMEDNLQQARVMAEEASRAKSEFLSHMSHELRTPLNGIYGFFQLIATKMDRGKADPEKLRAMVDQGIASSRHLIAIVNDLLDLSRIEAGRIDFDFVICDLAEVLDQMRSRMDSLVDQKGLGFIVECPRACVQVRADRKYLDQVLFNLVGNAIKFTDQGRVSVYCRKLNDRLAEVVVADTGCGIAPGNLIKIFDRFEMVGSRHRSQEGTGLGLAISKKLVELMGGTIHARSKPGKGSSFHFTLPLVQSVKEVEDAQSNDRG